MQAGGGRIVSGAERAAGGTADEWIARIKEELAAHDRAHPTGCRRRSRSTRSFTNQQPARSHLAVSKAQGADEITSLGAREEHQEPRWLGRSFPRCDQPEIRPQGRSRRGADG